MILDFPSVRTLDESVDAVLGNGEKMFLMLRNPLCDVSGRLIIQQLFFHVVPEFSIAHDFLALELCLSPAYVCLVVRFLWIVSSLDPVPLAFV